MREYVTTKAAWVQGLNSGCVSLQSWLCCGNTMSYLCRDHNRVKEGHLRGGLRDEQVRGKEGVQNVTPTRLQILEGSFQHFSAHPAAWPPGKPCCPPASVLNHRSFHGEAGPSAP